MMTYIYVITNDMPYEEAQNYIKNNIPDAKERIEHLLVIYNFDISTTRT